MRLVKTVRRSAGGIDALVATVIAEPQSPGPRHAEAAGRRVTSREFTQVLQDCRVKISMDGKGRYADNIFVERLWRTVKYEEVYLKAYVNAL